MTRLVRSGLPAVARAPRSASSLGKRPSANAGRLRPKRTSARATGPRLRFGPHTAFRLIGLLGSVFKRTDELQKNGQLFTLRHTWTKHIQISNLPRVLVRVQSADRMCAVPPQHRVSGTLRSLAKNS